MSDPAPHRPQLVELEVADSPGAWSAAGFTVGGDHAIRLGHTAVRPVDRPGTRGIASATITGVSLVGDRLDGLHVHVVDSTTGNDSIEATPHPNGATGLDHVVVSTPDLERTVAACEAAGLRCRRIRNAGTAEHPLRQAFFRLGATILEVVSGPTGSGTTAAEDPARWFGLAVNVADLDQTAKLLGASLGRIKTAVQPGRRIATLRHRELGLSVAVALMDDHGDR